MTRAFALPKLSFNPVRRTSNSGAPTRVATVNLPDMRNQRPTRPVVTLNHSRAPARHALAERRPKPHGMQPNRLKLTATFAEWKATLHCCDQPFSCSTADQRLSLQMTGRTQYCVCMLTSSRRRMMPPPHQSHAAVGAIARWRAAGRTPALEARRVGCHPRTVLVIMLIGFTPPRSAP